MFAYCNNNPVNCADFSGESFILLVGLGFVSGFFVGMLIGNHIENHINAQSIKNEIKEEYSKEEAKDEIDDILNKYDSSCEINFYDTYADINNSYYVDSKYDRQKISMIVSNTEDFTDREFDNISAEWFLHNLTTPIPQFYDSAHSVAIDYIKDKRWYVNLFTFAFEVIGWE